MGNSVLEDKGRILETGNISFKILNELSLENSEELGI